MLFNRVLVVGVLLTLAAPATAEERDYCPARPGLGTPACTIAPGRVSLETSLIDWSKDENASARSDTVLIGDTLVRIGLTDTIEAQIGWTPFGHVRTRDKSVGTIDTANTIGDALVGLKANLLHPDGSGLSIAVQPFATLPVGHNPVGAGDWGAGVVVPIDYQLDSSLSLQFTPELDAAVNSSGDGRHFAASGTVGLGVAISKAVSGTLEFQTLRDDDPAGRTTQYLASLSLGWMPRDNLQLDIGAVAGLNDAAPDAELYVGVARRF